MRRGHVKHDGEGCLCVCPSKRSPVVSGAALGPIKIDVRAMAAAHGCRSNPRNVSCEESKRATKDAKVKRVVCGPCPASSVAVNSGRAFILSQGHCMGQLPALLPACVWQLLVKCLGKRNVLFILLLRTHIYRFKAPPTTSSGGCTAGPRDDRVETAERARLTSP